MVEDVVRWKILEDWVFDKESGQLVPRIIGIAPMYNLTIDGQVIGEFPAFYVKWHDARKVLTNEEMYNRHNDAARLTYYDFFEMRLFSSYITQKPNVFDLPFAEYQEHQDNPLGALLEGQKTAEELMNWESDLWQY